MGRPARSTGATLRAAPTVGEPEGQHGVLVQGPLDPAPTRHWFRTEQEAKEEYERVVSSFSSNEAVPGLLRVRRVEQQATVEEEFLVRRLSNYLT